LTLGLKPGTVPELYGAVGDSSPSYLPKIELLHSELAVKLLLTLRP